MNKEDVIKMLDEIVDYMENENYQQALNYIKRKREELNVPPDKSSQYIEELVKNLK